jgi:hypothetical protein
MPEDRIRTVGAADSPVRSGQRQRRPRGPKRSVALTACPAELSVPSKCVAAMPPPPPARAAEPRCGNCPSVGGNCPSVGDNCPSVGRTCPSVGGNCPSASSWGWCAIESTVLRWRVRLTTWLALNNQVRAQKPQTAAAAGTIGTTAQQRSAAVRNGERRGPADGRAIRGDERARRRPATHIVIARPSGPAGC